MVHERITVDPGVMVGKPIIRGTRITVEHILRHLASGASVDDLLAGDPHLTREDVLAALAYAADLAANEDIFFAEELTR